MRESLWTESTLGRACTVVGGATPSTDTNGYWGGDVAWLTPDDLSGYRAKLIAGGRRYLTRAGYESCSTTLMPPGAVLFTSRAPIGYVAVASAPICTNQGFKSFIPGPDVVSDYLYWYLRWATPLIREMGSGTTFKEVSKRTISTFPFSYPSIDEQKQIVDEIEERFSRLEAAQDSVERALQRLTQLRMAVIASAIDREWEEVPFGDVVISLRNGLFVSRPAPEPPGVRIFRISAVRPLRLDVNDVRYAPVEESDVSGYFVQTGDLLFTRYSGNPHFVGSCAVVPDGIPPTLHPDKLIRVQVNQSRVLPDFAALVLNHGRSRFEIERRLKTTAGQVGIAGGQLRSVPLSVPSIGDQKRIIDVVSSTLADLEAVAKNASAAIGRCRQLRRAVLESVFASRQTFSDYSLAVVSK